GFRAGRGGPAGGGESPAMAERLKPAGPLPPSKEAMEAYAATWSLPGTSAGEPRTVLRPSNEDTPGARAPGGGAHALRALVEIHHARAIGVALRITRSRPEAEDAAQEAFVRAWRALPAFRGDSAFGTWLHRIVARRALDRVATLRGRRAHEAEPLADDAA